jgi:CrcB protein
MEWIYIGTGGALGAMARYGVWRLVHAVLPLDFPWGTLFSNLLGCFAVGLFMGIGWLVPDSPRRWFLAVGFLGALTTFSTFGLETVYLAQSGKWGAFVFNVLTNLVGSLCCVYAGIVAGEIAIGKPPA